uniref:Uncharacterized protein n=1 Tax=Vespula pensylvanica TaxID=30213 RepID=A0A834N8F7_VESPE|nr:hypothetical protein H0235_016201 [Vespula pensylvanica]
MREQRGNEVKGVATMTMIMMNNDDDDDDDDVNGDDDDDGTHLSRIRKTSRLTLVSHVRLAKCLRLARSYPWYILQTVPLRFTPTDSLDNVCTDAHCLRHVPNTRHELNAKEDGYEWEEMTSIHSTKKDRKTRKTQKERKDKNYHRRDWNLIKVVLLSSVVRQYQMTPEKTRARQIFLNLSLFSKQKFEHVFGEHLLKSLDVDKDDDEDDEYDDE